MTAELVHAVCTCEPGEACAGVDCEHCNRLHGCPARDVRSADLLRRARQEEAAEDLTAWFEAHPRVTDVLGLLVLTSPLWAPFALGGAA